MRVDPNLCPKLSWGSCMESGQHARDFLCSVIFVHNFPGVRTGKQVGVHTFSMLYIPERGMVCAASLVRAFPWIADWEEGACTQNVTHATYGGAGGVISAGSEFNPMTINVTVYRLSKSASSAYIEFDTTPAHLCVHHARKNTVQRLTFLSGMGADCTTHCVVRSLRSRIHPEWALALSSTNVVRVCVGQLGWGWWGGGGGQGGRGKRCGGKGALRCAWGALSTGGEVVLRSVQANVHFVAAGNRTPCPLGQHHTRKMVCSPSPCRLG